MANEKRQLSLKESGKFDAAKNYPVVGWQLVCKQRAGENSKSQRRKRNRTK